MPAPLARPVARSVVVVILTYNSRSFIGPCLDALRANTEGPAKFVVVDNASPDGTLDLVKAEYPEVEALQTGANLGVSKGNNLALAKYDADRYVMLNPDTEVRAGWLDALLAEVDADPRVGIVGGKLLYPDGRIQHAGGEAAPFGPRHVGVLSAADKYAVARDVDYVTFACALVTREVIDRIGYLDEAYSPYYYEDADYCFRARAAGFRVRYTPACVAIHHEGATMQRLSAEKARILERNRLRFKLIHDPPARMLRGAIQEVRTLVGHTVRGRGGAIAGAWADMVRGRDDIRRRRRAPDAYVPTTYRR